LDWIELLNTTTLAINISGWFLSDDPGSILKYQIPTGTILAPGGYGLFTAASHFGPASVDPGVEIPFGLSEKGVSGLWSTTSRI
jgi:hypothetical protein